MVINNRIKLNVFNIDITVMLTYIDNYIIIVQELTELIELYFTIKADILYINWTYIPLEFNNVVQLFKVSLLKILNGVMKLMILQLCVFFFVFVITFWSSKSTSIFKNSPVSDRKVNLVGTLGAKFSKNVDFFDSNFYEICQNHENLQVILKLKNHKMFSVYIVSSISYKEYPKHHYTENFNVTITIYPQTILNICYYSKSISRRYLKISPNSYVQFFLLSFEVQILTKNRQNHESLQIILPLKHKPPFSPTTGNYILG
ncbi:hypothetical protein AGLY_009390 [Aphis glycines]|uniref:Uncharacterized protein n=1 Tax=Aphis glycines TaxID=307491 RepID=A0A6G0THG8_APHGL|nr:hypothetical protein AGLY_009390 [Aphis glycines]